MVVIWLSYACFLRILGVLSGGRGGVLHWGGVDQGSVFEHHEFYVYYANKLHGITSATILLVAILHSMLLAFGHWNSLVSSFPLWMPLGENLAIMYNLGTLAACMMLFLALHGYFRNWFWKKWSHKAWVRTHFWTTICLIIIIFIHAITIGEELQFLGLSIRS